ncbi:secretory lipase-domain-containing protein [Talaromyces proteolyticus]|uniref:Secretory lipase-domain-containing protein n=1 Tax=Talaromyces proteolyticus TaxID=1131652 RepID=A0AAD4KGZ7_9EURO|nr:secretory lipase-domain-containing protein [Talaromyces proteolyticus]KAH8690873.1 secretory lipase-domain-containing protein [Talaromyces proteolyticus]
MIIKSLIVAGYESEAPGTILAYRAPPGGIAAFSAATVNLDAAWQVLYRTTDSFGNASATVTTILIPHNADYTKLLSYQVAEDAADPNCAPSYAFQKSAATDGALGLILPQAELLLIETALARGWVVTVPDHLGPKSTFLANNLSGHAVLDNVRAALASSKFTKISTDPTITLWGYSGGSLASGFAAELHASYAPELKIAGAALGGTVPLILPVINQTNKGAFTGLIPAGIMGLSNEYPSIAQLLQEYLLPAKKAEFNKAASKCLTGDIIEYLGQDVYSYVSDPGIFETPAALQVLNANNMGQHAPTIPLLVYKSINDEISNVTYTDDLVSYYCNAGTSVEYKKDYLSEHGTMAVLGAPDAIMWLEDRMRGVPVDSKCTTSSTFTSLLDPNTLVLLGEVLVNSLLDLLGAPVGPIMIG